MGCWSCGKVTYVEYDGAYLGKVLFALGDSAVKRELRRMFPPVWVSVRETDGAVRNMEVPCQNQKTVEILSRRLSIPPDSISYTVLLENNAETLVELEDHERPFWDFLLGLGIGGMAIFFIMSFVREWLRNHVYVHLRNKVEELESRYEAGRDALSSLKDRIRILEDLNGTLKGRVESQKHTIAEQKLEIVEQRGIIAKLKASLENAWQRIFLLERPRPGRPPAVDRDDIEWLDEQRNQKQEYKRRRRSFMGGL